MADAEFAPRIYSKEWRLKWVSTQVLIIDEVSMIDPILFTKLDLIGKLIRENNKPFGERATSFRRPESQITCCADCDDWLLRWDPAYRFR